MTGDEATSAFAGDPQPVDIFHRGSWYSGELLGWRFDDGRALARVRCVVDGLRHSTWKELTDLRLPGPGTVNTAPAPAPSPVVPWAGVGRHESAAPSSAPDRARQQPREDDDTQPHALLVDRDLPRRPQAPRPPAPRPRAPVSPPTADSAR